MMMMSLGDNLQRASHGVLMSRRTFLKSLVLLLPSYFILRLHWGLNLGGFLSDQVDFFNNDLLAMPPDYPRMSHGGFARRTSSEQQDEIYAIASNQNHSIHAGELNSHDTPTTTDNANADAIERPSRQASYASVPLSKRRKRHPTASNDDDDDDSPSTPIDEAEAAALKKKQRQQQARRRRQQEQKDAEAWTQHPENITNFSYIPVGKYAARDLAQRTNVTIANGSSNKNSNATSPYAYAFVMGGVNEQDGRYLGMLYNILIASYILDKEGSSADVVVYVQMSANSTLTELPPDNTRLLHSVGANIRYLPKPKVENFHQIIMQKMVVLDLVEYRRVLFLDTDVMPFCNLDYVFRLSDGPNPILKNNLIIALSGSPANAGFFMLSPRPGELEKLQAIVAKQQERAKELPYPHFDENKGWGHVIRAPDMWWTINKKHTRRRWKFVGSHADQGLLYHWVKYVKRSVSIVSGEEVDNYGPKNTRERIKLEETLENPFDAYTCLPEKYEDTFGELPTADAQGMAPYRDFIHFLGGKKPWKKRLPPPVANNLESDTPEQYWFHMLRLLNKELNMGIDFENWKKIKKTPLGSLPKKDYMVELMAANQTLLQA